MTECYECSRLAELVAENSQLRVKLDELTCNDALAPEKVVTPVGVVANDANANSRELLPCPFCGGEARHYAPGPIDHHIECVECYADIHCDTEAEAIAAWNTRALEQVVIDEPDTIRNGLADGGL